MTRHAWAALALLALVGTGSAADLSKIDRRITKEPAYQTRSPRYTLLVLGPDARDRVWLVKDGETLYVDRNGDGDLTAPNEKLSPKKGSSEERGHDYEVGELTLGGKSHHNLSISFAPLKMYLFDGNSTRKDLLAAIEKEPGVETLRVSLEAELPHLKPKGRVTVMAGPIDLGGALLPATKAANAPIVHIGGPLQITFYSGIPSLRRGRAKEVILAAGTPGLGGGTFAMLGYDETIPAGVNPVCEIAFPPVKEGDEPVKKRYELKERC